MCQATSRKRSRLEAACCFLVPESCNAWRLGPLYLLRVHPITLQGPLLSNPVGVCVLCTCLTLIGVLGREEFLEHTDPPVSCPCAQPAMSKASSSRALCLSLWALSTPSTSLPRAVVSPQGASRPSPQRPVLLRVQPCPPCPPQTRTSGVCQPCLECPLPKDQTQLFKGRPMALQVPYLHGLPSSVHT